MANYPEYRTESGETRWLAVVRIKGFKHTSRAFPEPCDAKVWAEGIEREFRAMRDRGGSQTDVGTITVRQLIERLLADPIVSQLKWHPQPAARADAAKFIYPSISAGFQCLAASH